MTGIRCVYFDVGYTLVNEDAVWSARCREQAEGAEAKALGLSDQDIYREIVQASINYLPQYRTVVDKFRFKVAAPYRAALETLYPDAPAVLEYLSKKYQLGIIANQGDGLRLRLEAFGIARYFTHVISSWDVGGMKPDPEIFRIGIKKAGCKPEEIVMVGDRLDNDIFPAKALGMKTIWIKQGFGGMQMPKSPDYVPDQGVDSLSALKNLL